MLRRFRLERLEPRLVMAGNVIAQVSQGSLTLTGDARDNQIVITQSAAGRFTISGQAGTTINRSAGPVTFSGVTADIRASMGAGDDRVQLGGRSITVGDDLVIVGGTGDNRLDVLAALTVTDDILISNQQGTDMTVITGRLRVGGNVSVRNGDGQSFTVINPGPGAGVNRIAGHLFVSNGTGDHHNTVIDTNVGGNVSFNSGQANAGAFNTFAVEDSPVRLRIGGSASFVSQSRARTTNVLNSTDVVGNVLFSTGTTGPASHSLGSLDSLGAARVGGRVSIRADQSTGQVAVTLGDLGTEARGGLAIRGDLRIRTGSGLDQINVGSVRVDRSTAISTGAGTDSVRIDDSTLVGAVTVSTGLGADEVLVEQRTSLSDAATQFRQSVLVDLGEHNDLLRLGLASSRNQAVRLSQGGRFDGGAGIDRRESAGLTSANADAVFENFEEVIEPQPSGLLAYEGFEYPVGSELDMQDGGFGFDGEWFEESMTGFTGTSEVKAGSLSAGNLQTEGNHVLLTSGQFTPFTSQRSLATSIGQAGTTVWLSFVMRGPGGDSSNMGGVLLQTLSDSDVGGRGALFIGDIGESSNYGLSEVSSFSFPSSNRDASTVRATTQSLLVVRMEFRDGVDQIDLFVNPTAGGTQQLNPSASLNLEMGNGQALVDLVSYSTGGGTSQYVVDELRVGTSYVSVAPANGA